MKNILVVTGSVRKGRAADKVLRLVTDELETDPEITVSIADLKELALPFYDAPTPPAAPGFVPEYQSVKTWTSMVAEADGVILLTAEYNHGMTAVQKNALDWIYAQWSQKPVSIVGYGVTGAIRSTEHLRLILMHLGAKLIPSPTHINLYDDFDQDGKLINEKVRGYIKTTVAALKAAL